MLVLALFEDANAALPLGTLPMLDTAAGNTVPILEQVLTSVPLEPYSTEGWHAMLPAEWVR